MPNLLVAGNLQSIAFHEACLVASDIAGSDKFLNLETKGYIEVEWKKYVDRTRREVKDINFLESYQQPIIIHSTVGYIGGVDQLFKWAYQVYRYKDPRKDGAYGMHLTLSLSICIDRYRYIVNLFCYLNDCCSPNLYCILFNIF